MLRQTWVRRAIIFGLIAGVTVIWVLVGSIPAGPNMVLVAPVSGQDPCEVSADCVVVRLVDQRTVPTEISSNALDPPRHMTDNPQVPMEQPAKWFHGTNREATQSFSVMSSVHVSRQGGATERTYVMRERIDLRWDLDGDLTDIGGDIAKKESLEYQGGSNNDDREMLMMPAQVVTSQGNVRDVPQTYVVRTWEHPRPCHEWATNPEACD